MEGVVLADLAQLQIAGAAVHPGGFAGLQLDGQAVGIPAGDVGGLVAHHVLGADDDILENLIEGGAQMDIPVGVGGAVVEDIKGLPLVAADHLLVQLVFLPSGKDARLLLGQASPHLEGGFRQIQCCVVILGHSDTSLLFIREVPYLGRQ